MVAGHNDEPPGQPLQESRRLAEFALGPMLRKVTRDGHKIRFEGVNRFHKRLNEGVIHTPEMNVREMDNRPHGTITRKERGRVRKRRGESSTWISPSSATPMRFDRVST